MTRATAKGREQRLAEDESIVIAWAESCAGPGWSNTPVWYIVRRSNGALEQRCLQPREQSPDLLTHFPYSRIAAGAMTAAVRAILAPRPKRRAGK